MHNREPGKKLMKTYNFPSEFYIYPEKIRVVDITWILL